MKLFDILNKEYAVVLTAYGCSNIDTTYETDEYQIKHTETVKAETLPQAVIDTIKANAEYTPDELVAVWTGTVNGTNSESVTVYAPESWT